MQHIILTNNKNENLKKIQTDFVDNADTVKVATAFFYDTEFINYRLNNLKKVDLLFFLQPLTNYYLLKKECSKISINTQLLCDNFYSRFIIFYDKRQVSVFIIGFSDFMTGELYKNIETNAIFSDLICLTEIDKRFSNFCWQSLSLQPDILLVSECESKKKLKNRLISEAIIPLTFELEEIKFIKN